MKSKKIIALDLFSGAGGLSLGFEQAGINVDTAIEIDSWAVLTYKNNNRLTKIIEADITQLSDDFFSKYKGIDVVMGGPPCQGFSIAASNRRKHDDPRNQLYKHFLRAVKVIKPNVVLIENVKEILNSKLNNGGLLIQDLCKELSNMNFDFEYKLLNASEYGIPQNRIRFFLIAINKTASNIFTLNQLFNLPRNLNVNPKINLWDAISDLPKVKPRELKEDEVTIYTTEPKNDYQKSLRGDNKFIYNHIPMRHTERIIQRFNMITLNKSFKDLKEELNIHKRGNPLEKSNRFYDQNHRRLDPKKPSPTITASFYSSFIHPFENRNLTVREAARLQSYPDSYRFFGKRTTLSKKLLSKKGLSEDLHLDQFNQVGNSVPPILAKLLALSIKNYLTK